jgi:hypothetical protein
MCLDPSFWPSSTIGEMQLGPLQPTAASDPHPKMSPRATRTQRHTIAQTRYNLASNEINSFRSPSTNSQLRKVISIWDVIVV